MNKRNKLKVFAPESSFSTLRSDSIILNPKISIETNNFAKEEKKYFSITKVFNFIKSYIIVFKSNCVSIMIFIGFAFIFLRFYENSKIDSEDLQMLLKENLILSEENIKLKQNKILITNICLIEYMTEIIPLTKVYKYGFLRRLESDPNCIMRDSNECFAFKTNSGAFDIKLKKSEELIKIALYHPITGNLKSAIKQFEIICNDKKFNYEYNSNGYQEFELNGICNCIRVNIVNNHGEKKYTTIYRIYLFVKKSIDD